MPILRRNTQSAATTQPADPGAVPNQRGTQEGTGNAETAEDSRNEGQGATGMGSSAAQTEQRQAESRRAGAQAYGEAAESRPDARRRNYGMAATLMILSGLLTFFIGITGIIKGVFFNSVATFPFYYSVRSRGVTLLVIGVVALAVGLALLVRRHWARTVATVVAVVSAIANFMFLPFYPFWSIIVLILDVIIIWELTREGDRREFARLPCPASDRMHPRKGDATRDVAHPLEPTDCAIGTDRACRMRIRHALAECVKSPTRRLTIEATCGPLTMAALPRKSRHRYPAGVWRRLAAIIGCLFGCHSPLKDTQSGNR
jgi:hypothetical protein